MDFFFFFNVKKKKKMFPQSKIQTIFQLVKMEKDLKLKTKIYINHIYHD